jgi:hypothetical protein
MPEVRHCHAFLIPWIHSRGSEKATAKLFINSEIPCALDVGTTVTATP